MPGSGAGFFIKNRQKIDAVAKPFLQTASRTEGWGRDTENFIKLNIFAENIKNDLALRAGLLLRREIS